MGESVAVDPMGVAFAAGNEREELIPVYVDTDRIKEVESNFHPLKTEDLPFIFSSIAYV